MEGSEFQILQQSIDLAEAGRENAALAKWKSLTTDFRVRVLKFVLWVFENKQILNDCPEAVLQSRFGKFRFSKSSIELLMKHVPSLAKKGAS